MFRFFVPDWTNEESGIIALPEEERHHAHVVRLRDGEEIELFDGRGVSWRAVFELPAEGEARARVSERLPDRHREARVAVTLAVAPLKKDRFEWLVEKATELGVARIVTFEAERTVAKPSDRRRERWQQIATSAAKQCGRTVVPAIEELPDLGSVLATHSDRRVLLDTSGPHQTLANILVEAPAAASLILVIGPEGGFSNKELQAARAARTTFATLGERTLRAETAALAALAVVGSGE